MKKLHFVLAAFLLLAFSATTVVMAQKSSAKKAVVAAPAVQAPNVDSILFSEVKYRLVGPFRGGRSAAVTGSYVNNNTFYFGATGGGLWKTTDGGLNWKPVTDGQLTSSSVGAVAVSESNPDIFANTLLMFDILLNILKKKGFLL